MPTPAILSLLQAVTAVEELFNCHLCCHDSSGGIIALFGRDNFPMEHRNPFCEAVKGSYFNNCLYCDTRAIHDVARGQDWLLKQCHAGVVELVFPITKFNIPEGFIFAGPFRLDDPAHRLHLHYIQPPDKCFSGVLAARTAALPLLDPVRLRQLLPLCLMIQEKAVALLEGEIEHNKTGRKERIQYFLKRNHIRQITAQDLADYLELSLPRISQLLQQYFGKSFSTLLNECRLEFAEKVLLNSSLPIETIAAMAGFGTVAYFYRRFQAKHRITPTEYRQLHQTVSLR